MKNILKLAVLMYASLMHTSIFAADATGGVNPDVTSRTIMVVPGNVGGTCQAGTIGQDPSGYLLSCHNNAWMAGASAGAGGQGGAVSCFVLFGPRPNGSSINRAFYDQYVFYARQQGRCY